MIACFHTLTSQPPNKALFAAVLTILLFSSFPSARGQQESTDDQSDQLSTSKETVKYFKTRLDRKDILDHEITKQEAENLNHFRATYNFKGELLGIEFVPNSERTGRRVKKRELFPKPKPPFQYFEFWNFNLKILDQEIPENRLGDRPFYRATFLDSSHVKTVEYFVRRNRLLWAYYFSWDKLKQDSKLSVVFSTHQPLTTLDPHLFHPSASEMRPGWIADFRHNRLGRPLKVTVRDGIGNIYYFYQFKHSYETVGDTLNPTTYRVTTSEYFRSDSTRMGSHRLTFTEANSLVKKEFFDAQGKLTETIEYTYYPERQEVSVVIRDPKGNILHREVRPRVPE